MTTCNTLFGAGGGAWRFDASEMSLGPEDADVLGSVVGEVLRIKRQKILRKNNSPHSSHLGGGNTPLPLNPVYIDADDIAGLLGEAASEMYHTKCLKQAPFHIKWKDTGTSKSSGVDLIFEHAGRLVAVECKHPHVSMSRSNDKASDMLDTLRVGLQNHTYKKTNAFLAKLYWKYLEHRRLLVAGGADTRYIDRRIATIERCREEGNICVEVDLATDKAHSLGVDHHAFVSRLNLGKYLSAPRCVSALLLFVAGLHGITENAEHAA